MQSVSVHLRTTGVNPSKDNLVEVAVVYYDKKYLSHVPEVTPYVTQIQAVNRQGLIPATRKRLYGLNRYDPAFGLNFYDAANLFIKWAEGTKFSVLCYNAIETRIWLKAWLGSGYELFFSDDFFVSLIEVQQFIRDKYFIRGHGAPINWSNDLNALERQLGAETSDKEVAIQCALNNLELYRRLMAL